MKGYIQATDSRYQEWIDANVSDECRQTCLPKSKAMAETFPELRVVGHHGIFSGHAWCINKDEEVVDPTAHQFGASGYAYNSIYLELDNFPLGKCPWCGETRWKDTPGVRSYLEQYGSAEEQVGPHKFCDEQEKECMEECMKGGD
ncbi:MAG: hypothetical protein JRE23_08750 [Deltaproteobacteria bacterium]|nr:hypothetical protein [Deltaproteobacteria bacterium]